MSGIVAVVRTDGAPVSPDLIHALTSSLAFRGPDARAVRCARRVSTGISYSAAAAINHDKRFAAGLALTIGHEEITGRRKSMDGSTLAGCSSRVTLRTLGQ